MLAVVIAFIERRHKFVPSSQVLSVYSS